eukprot:Gb_02425 [translate_table: standard]
MNMTSLIHLIAIQQPPHFLKETEVYRPFYPTKRSVNLHSVTVFGLLLVSSLECLKGWQVTYSVCGSKNTLLSLPMSSLLKDWLRVCISISKALMATFGRESSIFTLRGLKEEKSISETVTVLHKVVHEDGYVTASLKKVNFLSLSSSGIEAKPADATAAADWDKRETKAKVLIRMSVTDAIIPHIRDCDTSSNTWKISSTDLVTVTLNGMTSDYQVFITSRAARPTAPTFEELTSVLLQEEERRRNLETRKVSDLALVAKSKQDYKGRQQWIKDKEVLPCICHVTKNGLDLSILTQVERKFIWVMVGAMTFKVMEMYVFRCLME